MVFKQQIRLIYGGAAILGVVVVIIVVIWSGMTLYGAYPETVESLAYFGSVVKYTNKAVKLTGDMFLNYTHTNTRSKFYGDEMLPGNVNLTETLLHEVVNYTTELGDKIAHTVVGGTKIVQKTFESAVDGAQDTLTDVITGGNSFFKKITGR